MNLKSQTAEHKGLLPELETDPETGLPKLPEGFAWEVENRYGSDGELRVSIVRHEKTIPNILERIFLGEKTKDQWEKYPHDLEGQQYTMNGTKESVKKTAEDIYHVVRERVNAKVVNEELVGLYPPKSIL
jgi:hypothetical protein